MGGSLQFKVGIPSMGASEIRCAYHKSTESLAISESGLYRLKVPIRTYLSEVRDNYFA
jgi:hypothetical protein